jgi:hypothetical protein
MKSYEMSYGKSCRLLWNILSNPMEYPREYPMEYPMESDGISYEIPSTILWNLREYPMKSA